MEKEKITAQTCPVSGPVQGYFRSPPIFVLTTIPQQRANNHHWGTVTSLHEGGYAPPSFSQHSFSSTQQAAPEVNPESTRR